MVSDDDDGLARDVSALPLLLLLLFLLLLLLLTLLD
jgi:hypothetical protein